MKHLIIGGCGFIGYNLAEHLIKKGEEVVVMDNLSRKGTTYNLQKLENQFIDQFKFVACDIRIDKYLLEEYIAQVNVVYHLASQVAVTTSVTNPQLDFEINILGTFNILEAVRVANPNVIMLYASTNKVYGGMESIKIANNGEVYYYEDFPQGISEEQQLDFHSPYGCSKGAAEQYIRDYHRIYGLRSVCFRQSCIYGPNQFGIEDQGWVAWFTIAAIYEKDISIYGDGMQVRDVLHVKDLLAAYEFAVKNIDKTQGQIYNVGGGAKKTSSLINLLSILEEKLDKKIPFNTADWRPGDQPVYISDIQKFSKITGWKPKIKFFDGIESLIKWAKINETVLRKINLI
ncbi:MAG: GDP-mannose 4,6-dehydratase [Bacteroidota bacterium]